MYYPLQEIESYVGKLAEIIEEVLKVDVEIIDRRYKRIAKTSKYNNKIGDSLEEENFIYKEVIASGKKQVVENPGFHKICSNCHKRNSCMEKFECAAPIIVDKEVIGVISLICYNDAQKKLMLLKLKEYSDFIEKMSELISLKVMENKGDFIDSINRSHKTLEERKNTYDAINFNSIITQCESFQRVIKRAMKVAKNDASVLIVGESGTGKDIFARAIHNESRRSEGPFIAINCGAIPDTLLESELFGYAPYAFSGASKNGKVGKFKLADKGTIFLDEIGDMPLNLQVKLLRVLQERVVIPVGSNKITEVDVRVISATNKDLDKLVIAGKFREDLYYRLNVIPLEIPPLRERTSDISLLSLFFMKKYSAYYGVPTPKISEEVNEKLLSYDWRGNVRELENTIEYIINVLGEDKVVLESHLPKRMKNREESSNDDIKSIASVEKELILKALKKFGGSTEGKEQIARALGLSLSTLYRKMEKYNINRCEVFK